METKQNENRCRNCGKEGAKLRCSKCKKVVYCNRACQSADWSSHKRSCQGAEKKSELGDTEIQSKIETFKKTYNANHLRGLDDSKIQEVKNSTDNSVLKKLIDNLSINPLSYTPQYVQGPYFCFRCTMRSPLALENEGDLKTFYFFGENHEDHSGHCSRITRNYLPFTEYIQKLSEFSPSFFDLYLETEFINKNIEGKYLKSNNAYDKIIKAMTGPKSKNFLKSYQLNELSDMQYGDQNKLPSGISLLQNSFLRCVQPETRTDSDCKLMRIHNIDIRSPFGLTEITDSFYFSVLCTIFGISDLEDIFKRDKFSGFRILFTLLNKTYSFYIIMKLMDDNNKLSFDKYMEILKTDRVFCKELYKRTYMKDMIIEFARFKFNQLIEKCNFILKDIGIHSSMDDVFVKLISGCDNIIENSDSDETDSGSDSDETKNDVSEDDCQSKIIDENYILEQSKNRNNFGVKVPLAELSEDMDIREIFVVQFFLRLVNVLRTDIYCLSRMFKKYNPKEGTNPEMPDESRNLIIYTGKVHSNNYIEFLKMYSEKEPRCNLVKTFYDENSLEQGCVKIY